MKWTAYKQGRKDGQHNTFSDKRYKGRKNNDYLSGYYRGIIQYTLNLIDAEETPAECITNPIIGLQE